VEREPRRAARLLPDLVLNREDDVIGDRSSRKEAIDRVIEADAGFIGSLESDSSPHDGQDSPEFEIC